MRRSECLELGGGGRCGVRRRDTLESPFVGKLIHPLLSTLDTQGGFLLLASEKRCPDRAQLLERRCQQPTVYSRMLPRECWQVNESGSRELKRARSPLQKNGTCDGLHQHPPVCVSAILGPNLSWRGTLNKPPSLEQVLPHPCPGW